jgi:hypothetical protein
MIIFGLILTTFELSMVFRVSWGSIENWLKPNTTKPPSTLCWNEKSGLTLIDSSF